MWCKEPRLRSQVSGPCLTRVTGLAQGRRRLCLRQQRRSPNWGLAGAGQGLPGERQREQRLGDSGQDEESDEARGADLRGRLHTPAGRTGLSLPGVCWPVIGFELGGDMVRFSFSLRHPGGRGGGWP